MRTTGDEKTGGTGLCRLSGDGKLNERRTDCTVYGIFPVESPRSIYLRGSTLRTFPDGSVRFENALMPPGQTVMQWTSAGYPDRMERQPDLPALTEGADMHLRACLRAEPADGFLLEADFCGRFGQRISEVRLGAGEESFCVPALTHSWRLQLVQTGGCALRFHHLELQTQADRDAWRDACGTILHTNRVKTLNILVPDLSHRTNHLPDPASLWRIGNLFCLPPESATAGEDGGWCDLSVFNGIDWAYWNQVVLLSYGPASGRAARELKTVLEKRSVPAKLCVSECSGPADLLRQTPEPGGGR